MPINGLEFQPVDVVFNKGLDTRTNPKLVAPGDWLQLENVTFSNDNSPRLRDSIQPITGDTIAYNSLMVRGAQAVAFEGPAATSLNPQSIGPAVPGEAGFVQVRKSGIISNNNVTDSYDCASINGFTCYVWRNKLIDGTVTGVSVAVYSENSGNLVTLLDNYGGATVRSPRVAGCNSTNFAVTWMENSTGTPQIIGFAVDTVYGGNASAGTPTVLGAFANLGYAIGAGSDMTEFVIPGYPSQVLMVAPYNGATYSVYAFFLAVSGTVISLKGNTGIITQVLCPYAKITGVATCAYSGGTKAFIAASNSTAVTGGLFAAVLNNNITFNKATTQIDVYINAENAAPASVKANGVAACAIGSDVQWFTDNAIRYRANFGGVEAIRTGIVSNLLVAQYGPADVMNANYHDPVLGAPSAPQGPLMCGKPINDGIRVLLPVRTLESYVISGIPPASSSAQNAFFMIDGKTGAPLATAFAGSLGFQGPSASYPPITTPCSTPARTGYSTFGANDFILMAPEAVRPSLNGGYIVESVVPARLVLNPSYTSSMPRLEIGPTAMTGAGLMSAYDGAAITEHGFCLYPEGLVAAAVGAAGSVTAGAHYIVAVYEWTDANGQRYQSAPSNPIAFTAAANDKINVRVPTLQLTQKSNVSLVLYMSPVGSLTLYRCTSNAGTYTALYNSKTVTYLTFGIVESDASLAQNEMLYTQYAFEGTTLPTLPPPPMTHMAMHQGRVFCDASDSPNTYWYSQKFALGTGLQWSSALRGSVESASGGIVGFCELDDKMIIFCNNRLYALFGSGPDASGSYSQYSDPVALPSDVGCVSWRSIVRMPEGIIFKSAKGWYLLGRDLVTKYIGAPVKAWDGSTVRSGALLDNQQECRWNVGEGIVLVYSYIGGQWSITRYAQALIPLSGPVTYSPTDAIVYPARSAVVGNGYIHCGSAGPYAVGVNGDFSAGYNDSFGSAALGWAYSIPAMTLQSSFIRLASINGFQRARWLYLSMTQLVPGAPVAAPASLTLWFNDATAGDVNVDYYTTTFSLGTATATGNANTVELRHKILRQKCKSVSIQLTVGSNLEGAGALGFQSMQLQVGVKRGTNKLPASGAIG